MSDALKKQVCSVFQMEPSPSLTQTASNWFSRISLKESLTTAIQSQPDMMIIIKGSGGFCTSCLIQFLPDKKIPPSTDPRRPVPRPDACFGPRSQISRNYAQIPALKCAADWNTSKLSSPSQNAQIPALKKNVTKRLNVWMTCGTYKGSKGHSFITRGAGSRIQALDCVCAEQRLLAAFIKIRFLCQLASLHCTYLALLCWIFPLLKRKHSFNMNVLCKCRLKN